MTLKKLIFTYGAVTGALLALLVAVGLRAVALHERYELVRQLSVGMFFQYTDLHDMVARSDFREAVPDLDKIKEKIEAIDGESARLLRSPLPREQHSLLLENQAILGEMRLELLGMKERGVRPEEFHSFHLGVHIFGDALVRFGEATTLYAQKRLVICRVVLITCLVAIILILGAILFLFERSVARPFLDLVIQVQEVVSGERASVVKTKRAGLVPELFSSLGSLLVTRMRAIADLEHKNRVLQAAREISRAILKAGNREQLIETVCQAFLANEDYRLVWVGTRLGDEEGITPIAVAGCNGDAAGQWFKTEIFPQWDLEVNPAAKAIATGKTSILRDVFAKGSPAAFREKALDAGYAAMAAFPLVWEDHQYGVLTICAGVPDIFDAEEVELLQRLAADISLAMYSLETSRRLEHERDLKRDIIETAHALLVTMSPDGRISTFNSQAEKVTGYSRQEVIGKSWFDILILPEDRETVGGIFSTIREGRPVFVSHESAILRKNGERRIINWHSSLMHGIPGEEERLVSIGIDVTEQRLADQALNRARADWERIFNSIQDPVMIVTPEGRIIEANPATLRAARRPREEIVDHETCQVLFGGHSPGDVCPLKEALRHRRSEILEARLQGLEGDYVLTIAPVPDRDGEVRRILMVARDFTEQKARKAEAIRAGQLAAIGELSAGVAHEINNPINGIINYAQLLLEEGAVSSGQKEILKRIIKEGERVAVIVRNLLSFTRQRDRIEEMVPMKEVIKASVSLLVHQLSKEGIGIEVDVAEDLPPVRANPQQLQQVFLNLLSNARYALNQRYLRQEPAKRVTIASQVVTLDGREFVRTTVKDLGTGIPKDVIDRVFDPLFTTKPPGEGTGIGLSISQGLVHENHGFIRVESAFGEYTSVIVDMPVKVSEDKQRGT